MVEMPILGLGGKRAGTKVAQLALSHTYGSGLQDSCENVKETLAMLLGDSFVDYYILNEFACNIDAGRLSTYIYKDISGKYKICVWDFNNACDNYMEIQIKPNIFDTQNRLQFHMLCRDENFTEAIIARYKELRQSVLSEEYLMNYIDETLTYLGPAIDRNFEKWGDSLLPEKNLLIGEGRDISSHEEAVAQLKGFLIERGNWMDQNIDAVREFSAESAVKKYNENAD